MTKQELAFTMEVKADPFSAYQAFTSAQSLREWMCNGAVVNLRPGGTYHIWWNEGFYATGEYRVLEEPEKVVFSWLGRGEPEPTEVTVTFQPQDDGTLVTLVHAGNMPEHVKGLFEANWNSGLGNLKSVLETGIDSRFFNRPMLGIMPGAIVDDDLAEKLELPSPAGVQLNGVADGSGAQKAGLQSGDVLVNINGVALEDYQSFGAAIASSKVGDIVEVRYYRDGREHTVQMPLSGRVAPDIPDDPRALARQVEAVYEEWLGELDALFEGVSDSQASFKASAKDWSVKQVLAHFIITERHFWLPWISSLIGGNEMTAFAGGEELQGALIEMYPTLDDLRSELRRSIQQVINVVAVVPDTFVERRGSYQRMGMNLLYSGFHPRSHFDQIREALNSVRSQQ